jgi:transposase
MYEFGLQPALSVAKYEAATLVALDSADGKRLPALARTALRRCKRHFQDLERQIAWCDEQIAKHVRCDPNAKLAMQVRGVGPIGASAVAATLGDLSQFKNGRQFSAFLGLVPSQRSSGGRQRLGAITKRGDPYLRKLLVMGARSALFSASSQPTALAQWASGLRARIGWPKATVALANRNARVLWKTLATQSTSTEQVLLPHQPVAGTGAGPGEASGLKQFDPPFVTDRGDGNSPELETPAHATQNKKATKSCRGGGDSEA